MTAPAGSCLSTYCPEGCPVFGPDSSPIPLLRQGLANLGGGRKTGLESGGRSRRSQEKSGVRCAVGILARPTPPREVEGRPSWSPLTKEGYRGVPSPKGPPRNPPS